MPDMQKLITNFKNYLTQQDMSYNTIRNYICDIHNFHVWYDKTYAEDDFTKTDVQQLDFYRDYLVHSKRSPVTTVNRKIQALRRFFGYLLEIGGMKQNPVSKVRFLKKVRNICPKTLSKQEIHSLLSIASRAKHNTGKRNYAIIQLILQTGLRVGEVVNLEMRDLCLYERTGSVRVVDGKGGKEREVPLGINIRKALSSYLKDREIENDRPVFLTKQGGKMTSRSIQLMINNSALKAKITRIKVTPHVLRHTFATNYLRQNPNCLVELSDLMGHDSIDTTAIYTKASAERLASTIEKSQFMADDL